MISTSYFFCLFIIVITVAREKWRQILDSVSDFIKMIRNSIGIEEEEEEEDDVDVDEKEEDDVDVDEKEEEEN